MRRSFRFHPRTLLRRVAVGAGSGLVFGSPPILAQETPPAKLDPIVVTATRSAERAFDLPLAIDTVEKDQIQNGQLEVNLSESLARIPGMSIKNRWNYAQDLQLSVRGFGARANFGVRGVRLYQDYIPATMPDGQGQTGSFSLASAQRIEVLRGPFSSLYGNASGGVISVFTEDGPTPPQAGAQVIGGSYGTWNAIGKAEGQSGALNYVFAGNYFTIDGYRDHSQASRELGNVKLKLTASPDTTITVVANALTQPEAQDPLGLTRAQWQANPQQADPAAVLFNTRKSVDQKQAGATLEQRLSPDADVRVTGYVGSRQVRQFLALSGVGATSSGGVTDLDGGFGGVDGRLTEHFTFADRPGSITLGANYEAQRQNRRGYVNDNGLLGAPRRDEADTVANTDGYLQIEFSPADAFSLLAGFRYSGVRFKTDDHYITAANPDDSGRRNYSHGSPAVGVMWHATDYLNLYANYGQGFETPTFIELAYRNVGSGLNFGLQPSVSDSSEIGMKALIGNDQRVNLAAFNIDTSDEIVIDTAVGGRTTYKNAAKTRRKGIEAAWTGNLGSGFAGYASYTYLSAKFNGSATTGVPPQLVPSGAWLPGLPAGSSAYGELTWSYPQAFGLNAALEVQYSGKMYVNDRNTDAAPAYTIGNLRVGFEQRSGPWLLREFARLNNFTNVNYVGSVIVGDTNSRYFEPSATRNFLIGVSAYATF